MNGCDNMSEPEASPKLFADQLINEIHSAGSETLERMDALLAIMDSHDSLVSAGMNEGLIRTSVNYNLYCIANNLCKEHMASRQFLTAVAMGATIQDAANTARVVESVMNQNQASNNVLTWLTDLTEYEVAEA